MQPLVENAIFHGIEPKGRGHIVISVEKSGESAILVTIEDNGVGMEEEQIARILSASDSESDGLFANVGLRSVHERLRLTFGDQYGLSIESERDRYTKMNILLPYQTMESSTNQSANLARK